MTVELPIPDIKMLKNQRAIYKKALKKLKDPVDIMKTRELLRMCNDAIADFKNRAWSVYNHQPGKRKRPPFTIKQSL